MSFHTKKTDFRTKETNSKTKETYIHAKETCMLVMQAVQETMLKFFGVRLLVT